jgi:ribosomal protein L21
MCIVWRPVLTDSDKIKVTSLYRNRPAVKTTRIPPNVYPMTHQQSAQTPSQSTLDALAQLKRESLSYRSHVNDQSNGLYAITEIDTRPYSVTLNDLVISKRLPHTRVGDILQLTRVREIGSKSCHIRGQPLINPQYVNIQAMVMSHTWSAKYTTYRRRLGRGPGDRKFRKRSHRDNLTILRITALDVA